MQIPSRAARLWWRHGRPVRLTAAALLFLLAVASWPSGQDEHATRPVTVAARDIASGQRLAAADLTVAATGLAVDTPAPDQAVGELVRGPVAAGEPVTWTRLAPGRGVAPGSGTLVMPLPVADDRIAALLQSGDRVDVLVAPDSLHGGRPRVAARDVEVLAVPQPPSGTGLSAPDSGSVVLLAVAEDQAGDLAAIRQGDHVTLAIR